MGDIIDFPEFAKAPKDRIEAAVRLYLSQYDAADSAPWVAETIHKMLVKPELKYSFNVQVSLPADETEIRRISDEHRQHFERQCSSLLESCAKIFLHSYFDRVMHRSES